MKQPSKLVVALSGAIVALAVGVLLRSGLIPGSFPLRLVIATLVGAATFPLIVAVLSRLK